MPKATILYLIEIRLVLMNQGVDGVGICKKPLENPLKIARGVSVQGVDGGKGPVRRFQIPYCLRFRQRVA